MRLAFAAVLGVSVLALQACKGDPQKCEQAARNYATLTYWKRVDAEIALLPPDKQKGARTRKLSEFTNALEHDIDFFTSQCVSANNDTQVDCMIAAKTADEVGKCADLASK
jgi:hypothetical protein